MRYYFKSAQADEVVFMHKGSGVLYSQKGKLAFSEGDYLIIPRTIIHQFHFAEGAVRVLIIESFSSVETVRPTATTLGSCWSTSPTTSMTCARPISW